MSLTNLFEFNNHCKIIIQVIICFSCIFSVNISMYSQEKRVCTSDSSISIYLDLSCDNKNIKSSNELKLNYEKAIQSVIKKLSLKYEINLINDSTNSNILLKCHIYFGKHSRTYTSSFNTYNIKFQLIDNYSKEVITGWVKNVDSLNKFNIGSDLIFNKELLVFDVIFAGYFSPKTKILKNENLGIDNLIIHLKPLVSKNPFIKENLCFLENIYENIFIYKQIESHPYRINRMYNFDLNIVEKNDKKPYIVIDGQIEGDDKTAILILNFWELTENTEKRIEHYEIRLNPFRVINKDFIEFMTKVNKISRIFLEDYFHKP